MPMARQKGERPNFSTAIVSSFQFLVYKRAFRCMEECSGIVQLIWTVCSNEIVRIVVVEE